MVIELKTILTNFLWNSKTPKLKHSTLITDYDECGLKSADTESKLKAIQKADTESKLKAYIGKRLRDNNDHSWKVIRRAHHSSLTHRMGFLATKKTGDEEQNGPSPNLAISSQMTMKLGKDILWVEIFTN